MKPTQIVQAYRAIQELSGTVLPYRASRNIAALTKCLGEEFETIAAMERNLLDEYGGVIEPDGSIKFPTPDSTEEFARKYKAVMEQDDEISLPAVDLSKYVDSIRISADAMKALDGIVCFEKDGEL